MPMYIVCFIVDNYILWQHLLRICHFLSPVTKRILGSTKKIVATPKNIRKQSTKGAK